MTTGTLEERVARLEGAYEHLATKADLHQMENRLLRWMVGTILAGVGLTASLASGITLALNRLLDS